jgi:uncharacterized protein
MEDAYVASWDGGKRMRRLKLLTLVVLAAFLAVAAPARADEQRIVRIGTGGIGGTYYPIGTIIAALLSEGAIPGLLAVAQTSNGSVSNVEALHDGLLELALAQSNVTGRAYRGEIEGQGQIRELRAIANIYVEVLHLVARAGTKVETPADLRGLRVSLDERGSGTLGDARLVLDAFGLAETDVNPEYIKPDLAMSQLVEGRLDAFFIVAGPPVATLAAAADSIDLVPIDGEPVTRLLAAQPAYQPVVVPAGIYAGKPELRSIGVGAQLVTRADMDDDLIYGVTRALWSEPMQKRLMGGHPKGREISIERALDGLAIPLHPGAARYYREAGLLR